MGVSGEKSKIKGPSRKNDLWVPNLVSGFIVRAIRPSWQGEPHLSIRKANRPLRISATGEMGSEITPKLGRIN